MKRNFRLYFFFLALILTVSGGFAQEADTRAAYDNYIAAYKNYQNAVNLNLSADTVKALAATYEKARVAYDAAFKQEPILYETQEGLGGAMTGQEAAAPQDALTEDQIPDPVQAGRAVPMPSDLKAILADVWSEKGRNVADHAIQRLEAFVRNNPQSPWVFKAKYELAKAYEILKGDLQKSAAVLQDLSRDSKSGHFGALAGDRLKYVQASGQYRQWQNALFSKAATMDQGYQKYRETSWLAIPVKLFRWTGYVGKMFSFNSAQNDFEKFQLYYEDLGSRFTPSVGIVFDQFRPSNGAAGLPQESTVALVYQNSHGWYNRWKLINEAHTSLDIQYFIVDGDIFGFALQGLLLRKAREGLKIRFMMDARGTKGFTRKLMGQDFVQELAAYPNVEVKTFNPVHENLVTMVFDLRKIMASNHDKIVVVDGRYSIVGGRNVSMNYFVDPEDYSSAYRDCDVVIDDEEVARQMSLAFEEEFAHPKSNKITKDLWGNIDIMSKELETAYNAMGTFLDGGKLFQPANPDKRTAKALKTYNEELAKYRNLTRFAGFNPFARAHEAPIKIIDKHSLAGARDDITDQLIRLMDGARKEIIIQNPYVVLSKRADAALKRAAKRGVPIYIHTNSPASTDSLATQAMFYADWKRILKEIPTCRIYVYTAARKLHAKNFVFDNQIGIVGTYNMDSLSEQVNSEVIAAVRSKAFATELRNEIMGDIAVSKQYQIEVQADGSVKSVYGPDDLPGKKMWLLKTLAKFKFLKPLI